MKTQWIILRTACAILIIFAIGVWVGKQLGPEEEALTQQDREELSPNSEEAMIQVKQIFKRTARKYGKALDLTDEQQGILRPIFVRTTQRMALLEKGSKARLALIEDFHAEMAAHLTDEQKVAADRILEESRATPRE